ncbi:MAG: DUF308 domain-containing protein [Candidatus Gastranaerophilales bacterium]|nr:DUF308 domain-containing protein [Candidatus Gastranaerophilales bacterium]
MTEKMTAPKKFFNLVLSEGILLIILGMLIIILPQITTFALAILLSVGLILIGIYKFINSIMLRHAIQNPWLSMIIALIMIAGGLYLTVNPFFNVFVLTLTIGIYFILEGINSISIAISQKDFVNYWWLALVGALVQFVLAFIIIFGLPYTALWTIGILIGVNMLFSGLTLISLYMGTKEIEKNME